VPALVLSTTRPLRRPLAVGQKSMAILHVLEAATGPAIEHVVLGSIAKSPPADNAEMLRELPPVLVSVTDCGPDVIPTTVLLKVRLEGPSDTPGAVPVPVRVIVCAPPLALSEIVTAPVRVPVAAGVNVTTIEQVAEAATGVEVEQVILPASAKSPLADRAKIWSALPPVLVKVTDWAVAVVPCTVLPNVRLEGVSNTPGAVPVPLSAMI
jgi:hypothetical protein